MYKNSPETSQCCVKKNVEGSPDPEEKVNTTKNRRTKLIGKGTLRTIEFPKVKLVILMDPTQNFYNHVLWVEVSKIDLP